MDLSSFFRALELDTYSAQRIRTHSPVWLVFDLLQSAVMPCIAVNGLDC